MDTSIIIFTIFGIILWVDSKRRRKRRQEMWDFAKNYKPVDMSVTLKSQKEVEVEIKEKELKAMLLELRNELLKATPVPSTENEDDAILKETIQEVIQEMQVPKDDIIVQDAEVALKKLGYKQFAIKKAIHTILESSDGTPSSSDIVKRALTILNN